ncbi:MAG: sugar phosphate isomerase/epimerase [Acidobacteria bacterium]|nr:MAG: sugar phosphate isomerase/epimerase [Acidobacteriota bacterium]
MTNWPVGLSTGSFYRMSIFDVLRPVRENGFTLLEISSSQGHLDYREPEDLKRLSVQLRDLGLEPFSFHGPLSNHLDLSSQDEGQRERSVAELLQAAEAAGRLGAAHFVVHPGPEQTGPVGEEQRGERLERAAEALEKIRSHCAKIGVVLVLENMLPHLSLGKTDDLLKIISALDGQEFGVCLDTGHANLAGDIYDLPGRIGSRLKMLHAHDNRGRHDDHLAPGQGRIDWQLLLERLASQGFVGPLMLELSGENHDEPGQLLQEAQAGREVLERIQRGLQQ